MTIGTPQPVTTPSNRPAITKNLSRHVAKRNCEWCLIENILLTTIKENQTGEKFWPPSYTWLDDVVASI